MSNRFISILVSVLLAGAAGSGCYKKSMSAYTKGVPRRVEIKKAALEPSIVVSAVRTDHAAVTLRVLELHPVRIERQVHYSTLELRNEHGGGVAWELLEMPLAAFMLAGFPPLLFWNPLRETAERKIEVYGDSILLVMLHPGRSFFSSKTRAHVSDREIFRDPSALRQYNIKLPVEETTLQYRVLDASYQALSAGTIQTDIFGKVVIAEVPPEAVGIELTSPGFSTIAAIDQGSVSRVSPEAVPPDDVPTDAAPTDAVPTEAAPPKAAPVEAAPVEPAPPEAAPVDPISPDSNTEQPTID